MKGKAKGIMMGFLMAALAVLPAGAALAAKPAPATYLALGDSLAVGVGAAPLEWQFGYVGRFDQWFRDSREGPHQVTNLAVGGETSGSFIAGGQLAAAAAAINDPETDVQVVTLDIGGNDLLGLLGGVCFNPATLECQTAIGAALGTFVGNYSYILGTVAGALAADPGAKTILVMTYDNPFDGTGHPYEGPVDLTLL
ncbi:MAG: hypothetical protein HY532_09380, partial [Chloroflexi bacterium]|nr:hypothetical protein [Chloroflexota bacterium]